MYSQIIASFLIFLYVNGECTLSNLYKDSTTQTTVRIRLTNFFEYKFAEVKQEAREKAKFLLPPADYFKKDIKKLFVEYGHPLKNYEDLDIILKGLNYTRIPVFRAYREDIVNFRSDLDFEKWI